MKPKKSLKYEELEKAFGLFYDNCCNKKHSRYKSYEHCKKVFDHAFEDIKQQKYSYDSIPYDILDNLCLNLAFYLASWGMLRNSDLLERDYKIHEKTIPVILKYYDLNNLEISKLQDEIFLEKIMDLKKEITQSYVEKVENPISRPSETLITKIILGTLGVVPAYDDYLADALRYYDLCGASGLFTKNSLRALSEYFTQPQVLPIITKLQDKINQNETTLVFYSKTKVVDMILWELGAKLQKK